MTRRRPFDASAVSAGDRRALARAITLVESSRVDDRARATRLIDELMPKTGGALRIGITGTPGVGKSTFIEAFGVHLVEREQQRVAVLAVDPSSSRTGGSILGDKTRMEHLSRHPNAFIRPSPAGGTLGGVARRTREAMLLCEAAGFDVVLVETVGVGQSETAVAQMTDAFVLLIAPAAGDELQGVKRGIMELADIVVVNKSDGPLKAVAAATAADYASALRLMRPRSHAWTPPVLRVSALNADGVSDVWDTLCRYRAALEDAGELAERRGEQNRAWLWDEVRETIIDQLHRDPSVASIEADVIAGRRTPAAAAQDVLRAWQAPK